MLLSIWLLDRSIKAYFCQNAVESRRSFTRLLQAQFDEFLGLLKHLQELFDTFQPFRSKFDAFSNHIFVEFILTDGQNAVESRQSFTRLLQAQFDKF